MYFGLFEELFSTFGEDETMNTILKQVFDVVHASLNSQPYSIPIEDEKSLFLMLKDNGLMGLVFESLLNGPYSNHFKLRIRNEGYAFVSSDSLQSIVLERLRFLFTQNQLPFIFLKGSIVRALYPKSYMRGMGDIDLLVHEDQLDLTVDMLVKNGFLLNSRSIAHDVLTSIEGVSIEVHPRLDHDFEPAYQAFFANSWQYANPKSQFEYRFLPEFELVYLTYHLAKHLSTSGIGLRSVLDIGIYLQSFQSQINGLHLQKMLDESSLWIVFSRLHQINRDCFGQDVSIACELARDLPMNRLESLIDYIATSGIHGKASHHNSMLARYSTLQRHGKGKFSLICQIIFPSYRVMKEIYPILKRLPLFLPILWFYRILRKLLGNSFASKRKIKQLRFDKLQSVRVQKIMKDFGL
jgi:hypothetical protein